MKSLILSLNTLNDLDVQLQSIRKDLERLPRQLAEKEEEPRLIKDQIERRKAEVMRLKVDADGFDLEIKAGMEALKRYSNQLNLLRTTKEVDTVRRQMEAQRTWNRENEDKGLALMTQADERQVEVEALVEKLAATEELVAVERDRTGQDVSELNVTRNALEAKRADMAKRIPSAELAVYERIVVNRGQATTKVNKGFCASCHMKLPPQVHNLVLLGKELITCPCCDRIMTAD